MESYAAEDALGEARPQPSLQCIRAFERHGGVLAVDGDGTVEGELREELERCVIDEEEAYPGT
jgi:hypothetical protein